jgi:hypothetical protein
LGRNLVLICVYGFQQTMRLFGRQETFTAYIRSGLQFRRRIVAHTGDAPFLGYRAYAFSQDTGDAGWWVWAYTAQIGNGMSATISAEERRASQILGLNGAVGTPVAGSIVAPGTQTLGYGGIQSPDFVGNVRVDQTWGSAQIMGAAHEVNSLYYDGVSPLNSIHTASGHPDDQWGWAVGAGLRLNFPMIAQGDYFQSEVNYTHGAIQYLVKSAVSLAGSNSRGVTLSALASSPTACTPRTVFLAVIPEPGAN